ncbi:MAG: hypothetical protein ACERKD_23970 [Prolixibacteraceae bacterium]
MSERTVLLSECTVLSSKGKMAYWVLDAGLRAEVLPKAGCWELRTEN